MTSASGAPPNWYSDSVIQVAELGSGVSAALQPAATTMQAVMAALYRKAKAGIRGMGL